MIKLDQILTTARFEFTRSITPQRIFASAVLAAFPPAMLLIVLLGEGGELAKLATCVMVLFVGLLALLLWATPNVHGELEGRSWSYVTSRYRGRYAVLFGKYLNAVIWAILVAWTSVTICVLETDYFVSDGDLTGNWLAFTTLVFVAAPMYGAMFSLIGVIFSRRSMVFGAGFIILFEMMLAWVPANINKITGGYHLLVIASAMLGWIMPLKEDEWKAIYGNSSVVGSSIGLFLITVLCLVAAAVIIRWREFITSDESG